MKIKYTFSATIWQSRAGGAWFFASLPLEMSSEIRQNCKSFEEGWGRLKIIAIIGNYEWKTAIWFDTKQTTYLLPLKAEVRKMNKISLGQEVEFSVLV